MIITNIINLPVKLTRSLLLPASYNLTDVKFYGSPGQSQQKKIPKDRRLQVMPGSWVNERDILATQCKLDYHPGLNCGIDPRDLSIFAIRAGKVYVTTERIQPDLQNEICQRFYGEREGQIIYKRHINVIPKETGTTFRLINLV